MRESVKKSVDDSLVKGFEKYPAGSIVLCNACSKPIFKLDRAVCLGDKAGGAAKNFVPLSVADLDTLAARDDIDAGVRAAVLVLTHDERKAHIAQLHEMRSGDPMLCPCCDDCFVQVLAVTKHEVLDKAYTIELLTIPPQGVGKPAPVRGRQIGAYKGWVH
jgi:hypothetical protein